MREEVKLKILKNILNNVSQRYDEFIDNQKNKLNEFFEKATKDPLTTLYNRAYMMDFVSKKLEQIHREKKAEAFLVFVDLDNFKYVNDTFGHDKGDLILVEVANIFNQFLRRYDLVARYGGDEFLLYIEADLETIQKIMRRIEERVSERFQEYGIGISYGYAALLEAQDVQELIRLADKRMYKQKIQKKRQSS